MPMNKRMVIKLVLVIFSFMSVAAQAQNFYSSEKLECYCPNQAKPVFTMKIPNSCKKDFRHNTSTVICRPSQQFIQIQSNYCSSYIQWPFYSEKQTCNLSIRSD